MGKRNASDVSTRVVFLDYDGVVNTPMWNEKGTKCVYGFPKDNKVNNYQAVQWLSEFCQRCHYDIVVTSTWRLGDNYADCLRNGGLRDGINIVGKTEDMPFNTRADEVQEYLKRHPEIKYYIIVDDEDCWFTDDDEMRFHFVQTSSDYGFGMPDYTRCINIYNKDVGHHGSRGVIK